MNNFSSRGVFPGLEATSQYETSVSYFIDVAQKVRAMATAVERQAMQYKEAGDQVAGLNDLRSRLSTLHEVLQSAEWQEIDLIAPSDEELERYAEEVRPPADYYAE